MLQVTIFGGREGRLRNDGTIYLTLFGACELYRPTLARQLVTLRQSQASGSDWNAHGGSEGGPEDWTGSRRAGRGLKKPFFLTLFGSTEIKSPTLAEELADLQEMIRSGELTLVDWERSVAAIGMNDMSYSSFTMFGAFEECTLPSENEEVESLAVQCHVGNISDSARQVLQTGIGQRASERRAVLHRALAMST